VRLYLPTTLLDLAAAFAAGSLAASPDAVVSDGDSEEQEYAALMTAADLSASRLGGLANGLRRRVVVVAEAASDQVPIPLADVVAVHADASDDADPEDDLAWYATQEIEGLLAD
jgi:hypothetical protein